MKKANNYGYHRNNTKIEQQMTKKSLSLGRTG